MIRANPPSLVDAHIIPLLPSIIFGTALPFRPCFFPIVLKLNPSYTVNPLSVPIQILCLLSSNKHLTKLSESPLVFVNVSNFCPSKRDNPPPAVPIHIKPRESCRILYTVD